MFQRKGKKNKEAESSAERPRKKNIFLRILKYFFLLIFLIIAAAAGFAAWATQSQSGQNWLVKTANAALGKGQGLKFKLTGLSGSLPFDFAFGLESMDDSGLWLKAPENRFLWDWKALPKAINIKMVKAANVDISRFPELPPEPDKIEKPEKPLTLKDVQNMLAETAKFLGKPPSWLPEIRLEGIAIENLVLPPGLIEPDKEERLRIDADASLALVNGAADMGANVKAADAKAGFLFLPSVKLKSTDLHLRAKAAPGNDGNELKAEASLKAGLDGFSLEIADIPPDFLGGAPRLELGLQAIAEFPQSGAKARLDLRGPNLEAGHVGMNGSAKWQSGAAWDRGGIDGPLACDLALSLAPVPLNRENPDAPLNMLRAPANASIKLAGELPKTDLNVEIACANLEKAGHAIEKTVLALSARNLDIPLDAAAIKALERENHINLALKTLVDKEKVDLSTGLFFQALPESGKDGPMPAAKNSRPGASASSGEDAPGIGAGGWRLGLRDLRLNALGLTGAGNVAALLAAGEKPALDGALSVNIEDWRGISRFAPGQKFSGKAGLDIVLSTGPNLSAAPAASSAKLSLRPKAGLPQNVQIALKMPQFEMLPEKGGDPLALRGLDCQASLADVFNKPAVDCNLGLASLSAAGLKLGAEIKAAGPLTGPINAEVKSSGDVKSHLAAAWEPGRVDLKKLDIGASLSSLMGEKGKNGMVGLRAAQNAIITYGDAGIGAKGLDVKISPSGRLQANGGLGKDRLDFKLALQDLELKAWQTIIPQLPAGRINLNANLSGTPQKPGGKFSLALNNLSIPQSPLPPISLALDGGVENRGNASALSAKLELDPKTLKILGGKQAAVSLRAPLLFAANGTPSLNMNGPLAARVRWDGALGPIWNLLPIPDRRLNGRLAINIDAGGTPKKPAIKGGVNIDGARFEDLLLGILLTDINVRLNLSEDKRLSTIKNDALSSLPGGMTLQASISDGRGGKVDIKGKGDLDGSNLDINAVINRLRPLRRRDVHIELSGNAKVAGSATTPLIDGELVVNRGEILLNNLAISGSVTTLPISEPGKQKSQVAKKGKNAAHAEEEVKKDDAGSGKLNYRIIIPPRFAVEGRGLSSIWQANLLIAGSPANPQITGSINAVKGNFDFLGKNFALTRGNVTFAGGSLANPLLEIELTNEMPDLTAHIWITGPVDKMKISMTSEPSMPRDEILSAVLFGKSINDLSRLEALQLAAAVAQLAGFGAGDGIFNFAKKALGVDVLKLGTSNTGAAGEPGDQTAGGTTIEMGKYINDMIYMGVQQGMKPDSTAFIIQLELTPRTSLEVRTEQNNTWGGLKWKMKY